MEKILKHLENKYGKWISTPRYIYNHYMPEYGGHAYLNIVFINNEYKSILKMFKKEKIDLNNSLNDFYKTYNGLSFFSHSLKLYGVQPNKVDDQAPLDFEKTNYHKREDYPSLDKSYYCIGSYSFYHFCLKKKDKTKQIYVIDFRTMNLVTSFGTIESLLEYCLSKIEPLYNSNGVYLHNDNPNKSWFKNMATDDIF